MTLTLAKEAWFMFMGAKVNYGYSRNVYVRSREFAFAIIVRENNNRVNKNRCIVKYMSSEVNGFLFCFPNFTFNSSRLTPANG